MSDIEIEIKVRVEKVQPLLNLLEEEGEFKYENRQADEYFSPKTHGFLETRPIKEWLRIRSSNDKYSLNYKNWHYDDDGKSHHCDEYETVVEDGVAMKKVLEALGFESIVVVDKTRRVWIYGNYEISVDKVNKLGDFVEVEYVGESSLSPKEITAEMINFLKRAGVGKIERNFVGYPWLLLFPEDEDVEVS